MLCPPFDSTVNSPFSFVIFVTSKFVNSFAPLSMALPIAAIVSVYGHTMPPVGARSAPSAAEEIFGSKARISSFVRSLNPPTPLRSPRSFNAATVLKSSCEKATTSEPLFLYFTPSSLQYDSIMRLPSTLNFALSVPSCASYPACTMPLFALLCPMQTSSSFSTRHTFKRYFVSSLSTVPPITPPPITMTSNIIRPLPFCLTRL